MPWPANRDLPQAVKTRYPDSCQSVFRRAANAALEKGQSEEAAMRIGHTAGRRCLEANGDMNRRLRGG